MRSDRGHAPFWGDEREASSYDEVSRAEYRRRAQRFGGDGSGGFDGGINVVLIVFAGAFALIIAKLIMLQVVDAPELARSAELTRTNALTLRAKRGTVYDRNGNVLAISVDCKTIYCNPQEVTEPESTADILMEYLEGKREDFLAILESEGTFAYIERQVDATRAKKLEDAIDEAHIQGIYFLDDQKRDYPYGNVAGQILGAVGIDGEGLFGLEYQYDEYLRGTDGTLLMEVGIDGTPIAGATAKVNEATNGQDLVLSLDVDVQMLAESKIAEAVKTYQADSGTVMVTDPRTGEIIAACSTPLLNPVLFPNVEIDSMTLKPVSANYEPGSIFKVLTAAIGIENGVVTPWSSYTVPEGVEVGDDIVYDDDGRNYTMNMTLAEMMRRSSNTGISMMAQESIGEERFAAGIDAFGIGHATGIDFPGEETGIVRSLEEYDGSSLGSMSFGQGLAIPMVQMVRAIGAIANDGKLCTPHFVVFRGGEELTWETSEPVVSQRTCDQVTDMLREVVLSGTATGAQVPGYDVAGKTGTGEQADESGGYREDSFVASLIGYAPADDPQVLVYVGLNGTPYLASASAAPTFSSIMGEALTDLNVSATEL